MPASIAGLLIWYNGQSQGLRMWIQQVQIFLCSEDDSLELSSDT